MFSEPAIRPFNVVDTDKTRRGTIYYGYRISPFLNLKVEAKHQMLGQRLRFFRDVDWQWWTISVLR